MFLLRRHVNGLFPKPLVLLSARRRQAKMLLLFVLIAPVVSRRRADLWLLKQSWIFAAFPHWKMAIVLFKPLFGLKSLLY